MTWPTQQGWDEWWRGAVASEMDNLLGPETPSAVPTPRRFGPGEEVELVAGEHRQPGAIYRWVPPADGLIGSVGWGIGGRPDRRDLYLEYQEVARPDRRVVVRLDGLDACGSVSATSTLKHLAAQASFIPDRDRLLDVEVKLDWLLVRVRARVVPAPTGEQLRVSLRVVGRGLWKPVIAPLLVPVGVGLGHILTQETQEAADRLTHLDADPRGNGAPERELARIQVGAELMRARLHEVVRAVDDRPFWKGRGKNALRQAYNAMPAVGTGWPEVSPAVTYGDSGRWWDEEAWIFDQLIDRDPWRRKRHELVEEEIEAWLAQQKQMVEHIATNRAELNHTPDPAVGFAGATVAELNALLDTSWLASPWSAVRHLAKQSAADGVDDDLPPMETDEDARRFVTDILKEL